MHFPDFLEFLADSEVEMNHHEHDKQPHYYEMGHPCFNFIIEPSVVKPAEGSVGVLQGKPGDYLENNKTNSNNNTNLLL